MILMAWKHNTPETPARTAIKTSLNARMEKWKMPLNAGTNRTSPSDRNAPVTMTQSAMLIELMLLRIDMLQDRFANIMARLPTTNAEKPAARASGCGYPNFINAP